jgi:hypothetical protein
MAYTTVNKSSSFMNNKLYTGNGGTQALTGLGFEPSFTWIKQRDNGVYSNALFDAVRGVGKMLVSNTTAAEGNQTNGVTAFDADGFTIGDFSAGNYNARKYVSWNWKANGQGSSNTDGSINTTYTSANTTSGFSISKYTGTGSNATVGHGLGAVPKMIITKRLDSTTDWMTYHSSLANTQKVALNSTGAVSTSGSVWNSTTPTSSVFAVGTSADTNNNNSDIIAYCFADVQGFSKMGSYIGNGNADGTFVYTGFKPAFVMIKMTSEAQNWGIYDNKRLGYNEVKNVLFPNLDNVENTDLAPIDLLSNGFKMRRDASASDQNNKNGGSYIYMAFGQSLVGTNNIPNNAF